MFNFRYNRPIFSLFLLSTCFLLNLCKATSSCEYYYTLKTVNFTANDANLASEHSQLTEYKMLVIFHIKKISLNVVSTEYATTNSILQ